MVPSFLFCCLSIDSGECRRLGDISTPWPCFMVAGLSEVVDRKLDAVRAALSAIHEAALLFHENEKNMPRIISEKYNLKIEDARAWYGGVNIAGK